MLDLKDFERYLVIRKHLAPRTVKEALIKARFTERYFDTYTPQTVEEFLYHLKEKGLKASAINNYICALKRLDGYLVDRGIPHEDFIKGFGYLPVERGHIDILTPDEIKAILSIDLPYATRHMGHDTSHLNEQYKLFIQFLALTGCRLGEASNLRVKYVETSGWVTFVETKTKVVRRIAILNPLLSHLLEFIKDKGLEDYVFATFSGKPIIKESVLTDLKRRAKLAGVEKRVYPHLFRHSFITQLISCGVPIITVAAIVGHEDINTTAYYTHLADDTLRKALYRHPLIRDGVDPKEIIESILEVIKGFKLQDDSRFHFQILEDNKSLSLKLVAI